MTKKNGLRQTQLNRKSASIADLIVPQYSTGKYPCHGVYAKRWEAAYNAAFYLIKKYERPSVGVYNK